MVHVFIQRPFLASWEDQYGRLVALGSAAYLRALLGGVDRVEYKVIFLVTLHSAQLARVDHKDLPPLWLLPLEGEALSVVGHAVVVTPQ